MGSRLSHSKRAAADSPGAASPSAGAADGGAAGVKPLPQEEAAPVVNHLLETACWHGDVELVRHIVTTGSKFHPVSTVGVSPRRPTAARMRKLINQRNSDGWTPLFWAARRCVVARCVLGRDAEERPIASLDGFIACMLWWRRPLRSGRAEVVVLLLNGLQVKADPNIETDDGECQCFLLLFLLRLRTLKPCA